MKRPTVPYTRLRAGKPLLVLTEPARDVLAIAADGQLERCSLMGVGAFPSPDPTPEQLETFRKLADLNAHWRAD